MKHLVVLAISAAILFTACSRPVEKRTQWMTKKIASVLSLDASQKDQLEAMRQDYLKKQPAWEVERQQARAQMARALRSDKPLNPDQWGDLMEKSSARRETRLFMLSNLAALHQNLRPDQREKMAKAFEKMGHWHHF